MVRGAPAGAVGVFAGLGLISAPPATTSEPVTKTRLTLSTTYYNVVTALNANGGSARSNEVVVTAT